MEQDPKYTEDTLEPVRQITAEELAAMQKPRREWGKNTAINMLIAMGAFTLPWFYRGVAPKGSGDPYFPHQGEKEIERRAKQIAMGHIKVGDYKYGPSFVSQLEAE